MLDLAHARHDGVYAMWYGKVPGVDRSSDAIRHGNAWGTSRWAGVLAIAGDDRARKSSSLPSRGEYSFMDWGMPVLNPASVQQLLDLERRHPRLLQRARRGPGGGGNSGASSRTGSRSALAHWPATRTRPSRTATARPWRPRGRRKPAWVGAAPPAPPPGTLRGTALDPFGYTRERRAERRRIVEYEHTLRVLRESLSPGNCALAVQIAALPQQIRGFGDVERASWERVKREETALLDRFLKREHAGAEEADGGDLGGASDIEHL
jgi:hypothetical protein